MEPLSCANCMHNPLQLGSVGTAFGFCTRHRLVLHVSSETTCGELLRKDLLSDRASLEQRHHRERFPADAVQSLLTPASDPARQGLVSRLNGERLGDGIVEDVTEYGLLPTKIATLAALWSRPEARAEVALLSLGRAFFANCVRRGGRWTAGLHLARKTLRRLADEPEVEVQDLREPVVAPLGKAFDLARWGIVSQRIALLIDIGRQAATDDDQARAWVELGMTAIAQTAPGSAMSLLKHLRRQRRHFEGALAPSRFRALAEALRPDDESE